MSIGIALDGLFCGNNIAIVVRSYGGALGGVPDAPELSPVVPDARVSQFRPSILARDAAQVPDPQPRVIAEPFAQVKELRPVIVPNDEDPCG